MSYLIHEPRWHIDRRIPLALCMTLMIQIGGALIWAAQLDTRVSGIEKDMDHISEKLDRIIMPRKNP